jgi:hypothetical protein
VVLTTLFGMLAFTGALLKALDPGPLAADASSSLFAIGDQTMSRIFETAAPVRQSQWKYIYVHQSLTNGGDASTLGRGPGGLADHFVIGNGDGCADGEIQIGRRWTQQLPPGSVSGAEGINSSYISVCLVGDFNRQRPTITQQARLVQLVAALQHQLGISTDRVVLLSKRNLTPAGPGSRFPATEFRAQLQD